MLVEVLEVVNPISSTIDPEDQLYMGFTTRLFTSNLPPKVLDFLLMGGKLQSKHQLVNSACSYICVSAVNQLLIIDHLSLHVTG